MVAGNDPGLVALVSQATVKEIVTRQLAYDAIRRGFEAVANGQAKVFPVAFGQGFHAGESFAVKIGADESGQTVGLKIGSYWPRNGQQGLPAHGSTIVLLDPANGFPEAIISAAYLNGFRTAAANAIAVDFLARPEASVLGVIGAGHQAEHEIRAILEVRAISRIKVSTRSPERAAWLSEQLADLTVPIEFVTAEAAVRGSDIVTTVTPSTRPLVMSDWVEPGTHLSAMGADSRGKQELDTALVARARWFADLPAQSVAVGEFQHAFAAGIIPSVDQILPLGMVTQHANLARDNAEEITLFDSSGIAIQDLSIARRVLDEAKQRGLVRYALT
jgi:ornithine cyclodeaminase/alanine dehydrogenase-like protein (mu-crystallin family)